MIRSVIFIVIILLSLIPSCVSVDNYNNQELYSFLRGVLSSVYDGASELADNRDILLNTANHSIDRPTVPIAPRNISSCKDLNMNLTSIKSLSKDKRIKVYIVLDRTSNSTYVLKLHKRQELFLKELNFFSLSNHPYLVPAICWLYTKRQFAIVMQMVTGKAADKVFFSKSQAVQKHNFTLLEEEVRQFSARVYDTIKYIHWLGFSHGDLKLPHVLLSENNLPFIVDEEEVVPLSDNNRHTSTADINSPEQVMRFDPRKENIDYWAFGGLLSKWSTRDVSQASRDWHMFKIKSKSKFSADRVPKYFSRELRQVLFYLWNLDSRMRQFNTRPQQALFEALPYWKGIDFDAMRRVWDPTMRPASEL